jgi:hypothetical protein
MGGDEIGTARGQPGTEEEMGEQLGPPFNHEFRHPFDDVAVVE